MALNQLGLGLVFTAQNLASGAIRQVAGDFQDADNKVSLGARSMSTSIAQLGGAAVAAGIAFAGLSQIDAALDAFVGFENAIQEVGTLTNATTQEVEALAQATLSLSSEFGVNNQQAAKTFYGIISAGTTDAAQATELFRISNELAVAGVTDVTTTVDVLTSVMGAYGKGVDEARGISDILFNTMRLGKTTVGELSSTLGRVVPFAAATGVSFEEVGAAVSALAGVAGNTAEVITGLRGVLGAFVKPTEEGKKIAQKFGFELSTATVRTLGFAGTLDLLSKVSQQSEGDLAKLIGEKEALNVLLPLLSTRQDAFTAALESNRNAAGATRTGFLRMQSTLAFQLKQFTALRGNIKTMIGEALAPMLRIVLLIGTTFLRVFVALPKPVKTLIAALLVFVTTMGAVAAVLLTASAGFGLAASGAAALGITLSSLLPIFLPILAIAAALGVGVAFLGIAFRKNFFGIRDSIMKAVSAVKIIVALLSKGEISGELLKEFDAIGPGFQGFIMKMVLIGTKIQRFFKGVRTGLAPVLDSVKVLFPPLLRLAQAVGNLFGSFFQFGKSNLFDVFKGGAGDMESFGEIVGVVLGTAIDVITRLVAVVIELVTAFANVVAAGQRLLKLDFGGFAGSLGKAFGVFANVASIFQSDSPGGPAPGQTQTLPISTGQQAPMPANAAIAAAEQQNLTGQAPVPAGEETIIVQSTVMLDGEKVGEGVGRAQRRRSARQGGRQGVRTARRGEGI